MAFVALGVAMDRVNREKRSAIMRAVRSERTGPEREVGRMVRRLGYRFGSHAASLPGRPDLVFRPYKKAIFVHGCFWHGHAGCPKARLPKTRIGFWSEKIRANKERDRRATHELKRIGWRVLSVWQCQLKNSEKVKKRIVRFLGT